MIYSKTLKSIEDRYMLLLLIILSFFLNFERVVGRLWVNFTLTDLTKCKLSHEGVEYQGDIHKTVGNSLCQTWNTGNPIHEITEHFTDDDFVDGKKALAKNYCRNPKQKYSSPWCYTLDIDLLDDVCQIPLCSFSDCRLTGPGIEYSGNISKSTSGLDCFPWTKKLFKNYVSSLLNKSSETRLPVELATLLGKELDDSHFSDGSMSRADKHCRNPTGDIGGPWCLTKYQLSSSESFIYDKSYCPVPFCDEPDCLMFTCGESDLEQPLHSHWTEIPDKVVKTGIIEFLIQFWSPAAWKTGELRLALSYLPVPMNGVDLRAQNVGLEIILSNTKTGITPITEEESEWEKISDLLTGAHKTVFTLNWMKGTILLNMKKNSRSIFLRDYNDSNTLLGLTDGPFKYFSVSGSVAFWSFPFCLDQCEQHITSSLDFPRMWRMKKELAGQVLSFHVRAKKSVSLEFYSSPAIKFPNIRLNIFKDFWKTELSIQETKTSDRRTLSFYKSTDELSYWQWKEFSVNILGKKFELKTNQEGYSVKLLEATDQIITNIGWYSIGSENAIAHWTLFCSPLELAPIPEAEPPECVIDSIGQSYFGTQWVDAFGHPCLLWTHPKIVPLIDESLFPDTSLLSSLNYCRNPTGDKNGPYCYIYDVDGNPMISYCYPRLCRAIDCRRSGAGTDYIGALNISVSNRTCKNWLSKDLPVSIQSLFPPEVKGKLGNSCRNPNKDPGGPWCFTSDSTLKFDRCNVSDCDKAERSTLVFSGFDSFLQEKFFIAPHWKSEGVHFWAKNWVPTVHAGLILSIFDRSSNSHYRLIFGAEMNKKLVLKHYDNEGKEKLIVEKVLPHLIHSGKWSGFWLKLPGGKIEFGFDKIMEPLLEHQFQLNEAQNFTPTFFNIGTFNSSFVGIHFKSKECLTGVTESADSLVLFPINIWIKKANNSISEENKLRFQLRSSGVMKIEFFRVPLFQDGLIIKLNESKFIIFDSPTRTVLFASSIPGFSANSVSWSALELKMEGNLLTAFSNGHKLFDWISPFPLIYYFFSISAESGKTTWIANCEAPDIDGEPRNGGWGEWSGWECSVSCGGGQGIRFRHCDRPSPNMFGLGCSGLSYSYGLCNTHKCGTLSKETVSLIKDSLRRQAYNKKVEVGGIISLDCKEELIFFIQTESPESELEWTFNGWSLNEHRIKVKNIGFFENTQLIIWKADMNNSGVYACVFHGIDGTKLIIQLTAVIVWTVEYTRLIRATRPLKLNCHGAVLSYTFTDLQKKWILNHTVYQESTISALTGFEADQIKNINYNHSGEWVCVVSQDDLRISWVTAWLKVKVLEKPTFWTYLVEEDITRKIFGVMNHAVAKIFIFSFYVVVATAVVCFAYYYNRWVKEYQGEVN